MAALLFAAVFKFLPDARVPWTSVWVGALTTAVLFSAGKSVLTVYLRHGTAVTPYGAAGSLVVLLVWVYYSAQVVYLGAEFTRAYTLRFGSMFASKPQPMPINPR